jgi:two-component system, chemotaxis family, sensor kinase CheA
MNALFEQFLIETRELLEQAATGLLTLEKTPRDQEALNQVFRAFHSMKGAAALMGFDVMTGLVHAGEDLLAVAREAQEGLDVGAVDLLLAALDQVERWVTVGERQQALPLDEPGQAAALAAQLRQIQMSPPPAAGGRADELSLDWLNRLPQAVLDAARQQAQPLLAIRYLPGESSFYSGDDPFNLVRQLPHRLGMLVEPAHPWPALDVLDPYQCVLHFHILTSAGRAEVDALCHALGDEVTFREVPAGALPGPPNAAIRSGLEADATQQFHRIVAQQRQLLDIPSPATEIAGRWRAAASVVCNALHALGQEAGVERLKQALAEAEKMQDAQPLRQCLEALLSSGTAMSDRPAAAPVAPQAEDSAHAERRRTIASLRVSADKIDRLIELAGELLVAGNGLPDLARRTEQVYGQPVLAREIRAQGVALDRILREMQRAAMEVRMLPVAQLFAPLPRQVRDLARQLGKEVRLETRGETTEADKNLIEAMAEPLLHLIRNSIDHGIEPPAERRAVGKPDFGTLVVAAHQEGEHILIEVSDDGRGIDPRAIRHRALARGLVDAAALDGMDDHQVLQLVFLPGFSTAAAVSEVSGRGVGMDVVRSRVERASGQVLLDSRISAGTRVRLRLPLQMALSRVLVVQAGGQLLGVPLAMVREMVRLPAGAVQRIKNRLAFMLRDEVLPLVSLRQLLDMPAASVTTDELAVLVARTRQGDVGVAVDTFVGDREVLQKPMQELFGGLSAYSGNALLGDGSILLVLDLEELL